MSTIRRSRSRTFVLASCLALGATGVAAAEFKAETQRAWSTYVQVTEGRIARELGSADRFLVLDFGPSEAADRTALRGGRIVTRKVETTDPRGQEVDVPAGMVHHWMGAVLVPGARPETTRTFLRVQRTKIVTVVYNTEHIVAYRPESATRASSTSHATKIAELENPNTPAEREKPQGQDHGFLWGWNSYWRYEQVDGGVLVECESVSLSRSIPSLIRYLISPIIDGVARESMERTLGAIRTQFGAKK
jgi:hypothetical protein